MSETKQDQVEPVQTADSNYHARFNWKRSLITAIFIIVAAGVVGGVTWYLMDQNAKDIKLANDKSVTTLQKAVTEANNKITELNQKKTETPAATQAAADSISEVKSFCQSTNPDVTIAGISIMENTNGVFANCGLDNAFLIAKKINNTWTKLWAGNGVISDQLCDQYKIPNKMSGGTCKY